MNMFTYFNFLQMSKIKIARTYQGHITVFPPNINKSKLQRKLVSSFIFLCPPTTS